MDTLFSVPIPSKAVFKMNEIQVGPVKVVRTLRARIMDGRNEMKHAV
jgi:hypothetical protein